MISIHKYTHSTNHMNICVVRTDCFDHYNFSSTGTTHHIRVRIRIILVNNVHRTWCPSIVSNLISQRRSRLTCRELVVTIRMRRRRNLERTRARHWFLPVISIETATIGRSLGTLPPPPNDDAPRYKACNDDETDSRGGANTSFESCRLCDRSTGIENLLVRLAGCASGPGGGC